jgi:hypothetical protein
MKQIRVEKPKYRRDRADSELLALDPRDIDIVRAKALSRATRESPAEPES